MSKSSENLKSILDVLYSSSQNVIFCHYDIIKNNKFQFHVRPCSATYYDVYFKLAEKNTMDYDLFSNILLIGLNLKDSKGKYIYNVPTSSSNKLIAKPSYESENFIYIQNSLKTSTKKKNINILLSPTKNSYFKYYMEVLCTILMQLMYLKSKKILHKLNNIAEGMKILSLPYIDSRNYLNFDNDFIEIIRNVAKDHLWKPIIGVIVVETYLYYIEINKKKIKSFLEWQIMQDLYLYDFGVIRLMIKFKEITKCTVDQFVEFFYIGSNKVELEKTYKVFKKIVTIPSENFEEWIYFKYCGLINSNITKMFKLKNFPNFSSMLIGYFNSLLPLNDDFFEFAEFPSSIYNLKFYELGFRLLKYFNNKPFTFMIEIANQILKDIKDETNEDQINAFTITILKIYDELIFKISEKTCGVCLEQICFKNKKKFGLLKNCQHVFCYECINLWLNVLSNKTCPECRTFIDSIIISSKYIKDKERKKKLFNKIYGINDNIKDINENNLENNMPSISIDSSDDEY